MVLYLLSLLIAGVHGYLAYYVTGHLPGSLAAGLFQLVLFVFFVVPMINSYRSRNRKRHECYRFINSFIISLSVVFSGENAYETAIMGARGEEKEIFDGIEEYDAKEKLTYLKTYFLEKYYGMFLSMYELYVEQGGDILVMAAPLLETATQVEEAENAKEKLTRANLFSTVMMWLLGDVIIFFIKNSLANFYGQISSHMEFTLVSLCYFFFEGVAFLIYAKTATGENIRLPSFKGKNRKKEVKKDAV